MSHKTSDMARPMTFSKKCLVCGLRNFPDETQCSRCESDLSRPLVKLKEVRKIPRSGRPGRPKARGLVLATAVAILAVSVLFFVRHDPQASSAAGVDQPTTAESEQSPEDAARNDPKSQEPAKQVLVGLKRFQGEVKSDMSYEQYDQMLTRLNTDLNDTLPTFVRHSASDELFRQEVAGALRDYAAAGNWWKTSIRNSSVLNDADRTGRLQVDWKSAQTHLESAEKALLR